MIKAMMAAVMVLGLAGCSSDATPAERAEAKAGTDYAAIVNKCQPDGLEKFKPGSMFLKGIPVATPTGFVTENATSDKALAATMCILTALNMPADMKVKLDATNGMMGAQEYTDTATGIKYTWSYAKDVGLTIIAEDKG